MFNSFGYISSQIIIIIAYVFYALTYILKGRTKLLVLSFVFLIGVMISNFLLGAFTGFAMTVFSIVRNLILMAREKSKQSPKKNNKTDVWIFIGFYILIFAIAIVTYNGFYSLFSVFPTLLYTFAIWQKNQKVYDFLGIPISGCWIIYNLSIISIFGVILETLILLTILISTTVKYFIKPRKQTSLKDPEPLHKMF